MSTSTDVQVGADPTRFENEEFAREQYRKLEEQERAKREEFAEARTLQERLERQLAEESIDVPIGSETVPFRPFNREASQFASVLNEHLEQLDHEEDDIEAEFADAVDRMYAVAGEFSKPEFATTDWWEANFSIPRMIAILHFVNVEGTTLDEDETKK